MRPTVVFLVVFLAGCISGTNGGEPQLPDNHKPIDDQLGKADNPNQLIAIGCNINSIRIASHPAVFPFSTPKNWPGPNELRGVKFDLHIYSCDEVILGQDHVFKEISFAWESHSNLSWMENPDFDSNSLDALLAFYVENGTLASMLEDKGVDVTRARIAMNGDLQYPRAEIVSDGGRISLAVDGAPYPASEYATINHVVPPESKGEWLRFDMMETLRHTYLPWNLQAEGDSATATIANDPVAKIPNFQGYAAQGELQILWEDGFA